MIRYRSLVRVAAVVAAVVLGVPAPAQADYQLRVSTDGGSNFTYYHSTDGGANWYTGTSGGSNVGSSVNVDSLSITASSTSLLDTSASTMVLSISGTQTNKQYNILVQASITDVP